MKNRLSIKLLRYVVWVVISVIGGWQLTYVIAVLPFNMPVFVEVFIRFWLSVTGTEYLGNPEDMGTLALILYWLVATLFVATAISLFYFAVRHYRAKKIGSQ